MDKIYKTGYDYFFWNYEEQTKIKHFVVNEYFDKWIKIVGSRNKDLFYFDCHGGSGAYIDEDKKIFYGSPVLAAETIEKNINSLDRNVQIVIIEQDKKNVDNLKKIFDSKKLKVKPFIIEGDFDNQINKILDKNLNMPYPSFFFIDPFGFKIKFKTLKRIMQMPFHEIVLNFMFNNINRFLIEGIEGVLNDLFGGNEWKGLVQLQGNEREKSIVNLFRNKLKTICQYVFPYRIAFPNSARTYYYLFHLANHPLACSVMKSAFAKYNFGKVEYLGKDRIYPTLFDTPEIEQKNISEYLKKEFKNKTIAFDQLISCIIDDVPYLESAIRKALKEMEKKKHIQVERVTSKTNIGLSGKDIIYFV